MAGRDGREERPGGGTTSRMVPSRGDIAARIGRWFSPRFLVVAFVVLGAGVLIGRTVVPFLGGIGGLIGLLVGGFLLGLIGGRRRYLETGLAGGIAAGVTAMLEFFVLSVLAGIGIPIVVIGTGAGVLVSVLGLYFGRDLHAGLTRSL